jgi:xylitol oxidase
MVTADGSVVELSREKDGEQFLGAVVGLGGLGVVTKLTLDVMPAFEVRQDLYENLPFTQLEAQFETIFSSAYSVSLFTDWRSTLINQVWLKQRLTDDAVFILEPDWFEATRATGPLHPIAGLPTVNLTGQMGVPGPWYDRLPHFRIDHLPSSGEELQTEYMIPRQHAVAALRVLNGLRERIAPLLQISEVRTIAADNLWMSPYYRQDCVALHFTWKADWPGVSQLLPVMEEQLAPLEARPHWGKLFMMPAERVQSLYQKLPEFQQLLRHYDPQGKFRNAFLDMYIFGVS